MDNSEIETSSFAHNPQFNLLNNQSFDRLNDLIISDKDNQLIIERIKEKQNISSKLIFELDSSQIDNEFNGVYIHPALFEFMIHWIDIYYQCSSLV